MAKENSILTIDVGGNTLKIAEFVFPLTGGIVLRKFAFRKFDEGEGGRGFADTYRDMLANYQFTAKRVRLSLSGQSSFSRLSKLPSLLGKQSAVDKIVEYEARQTVPYAMSEVEWDYQLLRREWNEVVKETEEDGTVTEISEPREEFEALFVAVKTDQISCYTDVIEDSGRSIVSVEIAPVALFNAAKGSGQCRADECVLLLNIGGRGSNLMIADRNRAFIRSIPIAGDAITHQVAKEFGIGFAEAEDLKHRHGFVALGGAYEEPESEVAATISKIARNVMTRLHGEVSRSINVWRAQHNGQQPTRVLLAGGGSTMIYLTDFFHEKLRLPVDYLNTFSAITIGDGVDKEQLQMIAPMFQELIGMSLREITQCPIDISLIPKAIRQQRDLNRRKPYFYASSLAIVICLLIFWVGVNRRLNYDKSRVERVKSKVTETNTKMEEVNRLMGELRGVQGKYEAPMQFLRDRNKWADVMMELQSMAPDMMWFTRVEGIGDVVPGKVVAPASEGRGGRGGRGRQPESSPFGGGGFGMGEEPAASQATALDPYTGLREIKQVYLVGYTLILKRDLLESELQARARKSKYFSQAEIDKFVPETAGLNLTAFEMRIQLKEPIKK